MALLAEERKSVIASNRRHAKDSGSPEVQISVLTARINQVSEHLKGNDKDFHSRRGLLMMVGKRNRLLRYLAANNPESYQKLISKLGLRK
jgi:small subunit ribosomal protein S15